MTVRSPLALLLCLGIAPLATPLGAQKLVGAGPLRVAPRAELLDTTGMFLSHYAKVGDDLFIAGQPTERALREMKAQGVTVVVNLRTPPEMARVGFDEAKAIADLGMTYVEIPVRGDSTFPYDATALTRFTDALRNAKGKVLLHCTVAWRASHLWGAYLIQQGVAVPEALEHARSINLMDLHRTSGPQPLALFLGRPVPGLGGK
jgi:uncharacterized protein (TIGR01244 family)